MRLDPDEIEQLAETLAPRVADLLERRLSERPELAFSVPEAAAWCRVETHTIRKAITDGRLACLKIGRSIRIRRSDLFAIRPNGQPDAAGEGEGR